MKGKIINIQRFCTDDGAGIRTTVFLKGCPLRCEWCHNPESQSCENELLYDCERCLSCLRCVCACPNDAHFQSNGKHMFDRTKCQACGKCLSPLCEALEISGKEMSSDEILSEVLKDKLFYDNSGGGLTLSGGEPLWQAEFCLELLKKAKDNGLHVCMETCGFASRETIAKTAKWVDVYLFDCKETDSERHKKYTGVDNSLILENLRYLDSLGKQIVLRCPIIPTINDRDDHAMGIAQIANKLGHLTEIVIEPYHTLGTSKYDRLGKKYTLFALQPLESGAADEFVAKLQKLTDIPVKKA